MILKKACRNRTESSICIADIFPGQTTAEVIKMEKPNRNKVQTMPLDALDGQERPIPHMYKAIDNDLARDNLENDLPAGDLEDL